MSDEYAGVARLYASFLDPVLSRTRRTAREALDRVEAASVVDICCGTGALCRDLAAEGYEVTGVDYSDAMLGEAARRAKRSRDIRYFRADARQLPFEDGAYDAGVLSLCLHENAPEDRSALLAEAARVAKTLVVVDYSHTRGALGVLAHVPERMAGSRHYAAFRHFIAHGALEELLRTAGFAVLHKEVCLLGAGLCALVLPERRRKGARTADRG